MIVTAISTLILAAFGAPIDVKMNGKTIATNVKMVDGKPYVSLSDLAKGMGMTLQKTPTGYKLVSAGGANALAGKLTGNVGDELFTGEWKFTVRSVATGNVYRPVYNGEKDPYHPKAPGETLVIVNCRIKNGNPRTERIDFFDAVSNADHGSLTDSDEHGYRTMLCDVKLNYYRYAVDTLPGAAVDFALIFSVPKETKPKDLVYILYRYDDRDDRKKHTVVRVHLKG